MNAAYLEQMIEGMKREYELLDKEQTAAVKQFSSQKMALRLKIDIFENQLRSKRYATETREPVGTTS